MERIRSLWQQGVKVGLIGGVVALSLALMGMVETFGQRDILYNVVSMGHALLLLTGVFMGYLAAKRTTAPAPLWPLLNGLVSGVTVGGFLVGLVILGSLVNLRSIFINASPVLYTMLTFGHAADLGTGTLLLLMAGALCGIFAGLLYLAPGAVRRVLTTSLTSLIAAGLLQDLIRPMITNPIFAKWRFLEEISDWVSAWFFAANGMSIHGAITLCLLIAVTMIVWSWKGGDVQRRYNTLPAGGQRAARFTGYFLLLVIVLVLPQMLGLFLSEVLTIVGLYVLLGLGLNIVVGFAGLLDLGYVAFFAIGAYVTAILTSPELGFFALSFWQALPLAIILGIFSGVLLGVPVLKMRGDYLAIATLGFGEIIRILVLSDFLRPWLGGAQGVGLIPKAHIWIPIIGHYEFAGPQQIYYLILAGCALVIFISWRLRNSRIGRAWKAMREDEDVAQAMGINLVATKLLAFATGAGFSAISGAIFASKLGSVYPHSFNVMISINVICLIIVGGMGSVPGVIVGAAALVGLPELLREFAEYRLLVYGAALVAMMLLKPEGLWPEAVHRREFHEDEEVPSG